MKPLTRFLKLPHIILTVGIISTVLWFGVNPRGKPSETPPLPEWQEKGLAAVREQVEGFVVFERLGEEHLGIWIQELGHQGVTCLTPKGRYPRISYDGQCVYFLQGDGHLAEVSVADGKIHDLLDWPERIPAISVHPLKHELYFISGSVLYSYNTDTAQVTRIEPAPKNIAAVDVDASGDLIISTFEGDLYEIWKQHPVQRTLSEWNYVDVGCSAAISPDGMYFTDNENSHHFIDVRSFDKNEVVYTVRTHPKEYRVDNETWTNLNDWMVFVSQDPQRRFAWLYQMGSTHPLKITFTRDADRPDAYLTKVKTSAKTGQ